MIAVASKVDEDVIADAFSNGARALALRNRTDHVQAIVRREFEASGTTEEELVRFLSEVLDVARKDRRVRETP